MIHSMTGFGKAVVQLKNKKVTIELKSLNSKSMDLSVRIPYFYKEKELEIRKFVADKLVRGKVDLIIYTELDQVEKIQKLNPIVIKNYMNDLASISPGLDAIHYLKIATQLPDVLQQYSEEEEIDETEGANIFACLEEAINKLIIFRKDEGLVLKNELEQRIGFINKYLEEVETYEAERFSGLRERLNKQLATISDKIDQNRFEQELIYYIEKLDITEEKVRLKNHCDYFIAELNTGESNGRKLNFINQEIGREINTLGSKCNQSDMQKLVIQMKDELEKMKEQVLNVL